MLFSLFAILGESMAKTIDKFNYNKTNIKPAYLIFLIFIGMFICLVLFVFITKEPLPLLNIRLASLIIIMIIVSYLQNICDFKGLKCNKLSFREPINNFEPILASFIAFLLFSAERNLNILYAIIIGSFILYIGNVNRKITYKIKRESIYLLFAMIFSAVLVNIYKYGLEYVSPTYLFLFRVSGIIIILPLLNRINFRNFKLEQVSYGLFSGIIYFGGFLFKLLSIKLIGLNITILILLLGSMVTYFLSIIILKEKLQLNKITISISLISIIFIAINS